MDPEAITQEELDEVTARQTRRAEQIAAELRATEAERLREWERERDERQGVTPGVTVASTEEFCAYFGPRADMGPDADVLADEFVVKDSGARESFDSGMVRDTEDGKPDFTLIRRGPMFVRWAIHLTKGAVKYGRHNWTNANSEAEYERFQRSAARHFEQWLNGERDEDHAAAVMFNVNAAEYVLERAF